MAKIPDSEVTEPPVQDDDEKPEAVTSPRVRRRFGLRAGEHAETAFVMVHTGREDRVGQRFTMPDPRPRRR